MRLLARGIAVIAGVALVAPAAADPGSRQIVSKRGLYRVTISPRPAASPVGRIHDWKLTVRTPGGRAVEHARITVDGDMPAHGHGLATTPRAAEVGSGRYVVHGMKFQMGGHWYVSFAIAAAPGRDVARVDFVLPG